MLFFSYGLTVRAFCLRVNVLSFSEKFARGHDGLFEDAVVA